MREEAAAVLRELEAQERRERGDPGRVPPGERLLAITPDTGMFYNILLRAAGASRVLEVGTSAGYSAIWLAEAVAGAPGGRVYTIEADPAKARRARENLRRAGLGGAAEVLEGRASDVLAGELAGRRGEFDLAFIDADKEGSVAYFDAVLPLVRPGGLVGVDNVLYPERFAPHMEPLVRHAAGCPGVRSVTVPIGNGQLLCTRLG